LCFFVFLFIQYYDIYFNTGRNINLEKNFVNLYWIFDPLISIDRNSEFFDYFEFNNLHFSFFRNIEIQKVFFPYYERNINYNFKNYNFLLHKAVFSDFIRTRCLVHNTNASDWYQADYKYAKGWLNAEEIFLTLNKIHCLKYILNFKLILYFFILNFLPSDIFFLWLKYWFLNTIILNESLESYYYISNCCLFFFKFIIFLFPDSLLLQFGYSYKYFLIVSVEQLLDHICNFIFKSYNLYNKVTENAINKKKLIMFFGIESTDAEESQQRNFIYFFLYPFNHAERDFEMTIDFMFKYNNNIASTPFIEEYYDLYPITGLTNPRSDDFYSNQIRNLAYDKTMVGGRYRVRSYFVENWYDWSFFNTPQEQFSKEYYSKYFAEKGSTLPGLSNNFLGVNTSMENFTTKVFFGGDKTFITKQIPRQVGFTFLGPYSFSSIELSYISNLSTLDENNYRSVTDYIDPLRKIYRKVLRSNLTTGYQSRLIGKYRSQKDTYFFNARNYKKHFRKYIMATFIDQNPEIPRDKYHPYIYFKNMYFHTFRNASHYVYNTTIEGNFSFSNENYINFKNPPELFLRRVKRRIKPLIVDRFGVEFLMMEPFVIYFGSNEVGVRHRFGVPAFKHFPGVYPSALSFRGYSQLVKYESIINNFKNLPLQNLTMNFYKLWIDSTLSKQYLTNEMGKTRLLVESLIPSFNYKGHIEHAYTLGIQIVFHFFVEFLCLFVKYHLGFYNFVFNLFERYFIYFIFSFFLCRVFFLVYKIDFKNKEKVLYNIVNSSNTLFEKKIFNFAFKDTKEYLPIWTFSDNFKINRIYLFVFELPFLFIKKFFIRSKDVFFEFLFFFLDFLYLCFFFFFFNFIYIIEKFLLNIIKSSIFVRNKIFIFFWNLFNLFFLLFKNGILNFFFYLFYFFFSILINIMYIYLKIFLLFFLTTFFCMVILIINDFYNINIINYYPTYFIFSFLLYLIFICSFLFSKFQDHFFKRTEELVIAEDEHFEVDEIFDPTFEEDFYTKKLTSHMIFAHFNDFFFTIEGILPTDIMRFSLYQSDMAYYRKRNVMERTKTPEFEMIVSRETNTLEFTILPRLERILDADFWKLLILFLKTSLQKPSFFLGVRYLQPLLIRELRERELREDIFEEFFDLRSPRRRKLLRMFFMRYYISSYFYSFQEDEYLNEDNLLYFKDMNYDRYYTPEEDEEEMFEEIEEVFKEIYEIDEKEKPFNYELNYDIFESRLIIDNNEGNADFEFFEEDVWLNQFMFERIFSIDLTITNPIIFNLKDKRQKNNLYYYTRNRLDFLDENIINTNSNKFRFFFFHKYCNSRKYLKLFDLYPHFYNLQKYSYAFYHHNNKKDYYSLDYTVILHNEYFEYYKKAYIGFQVHNLFFVKDPVFFVKIMNPVELFDNFYKYTFYSKLNYYIKILKLKNFPNLTKKEFERILFYFDCDEKQWDSFNIRKDLFTRSYLDVEFPIFLFISFLYYLKENKVFFYWSFNIGSKADHFAQVITDNHYFEHLIFNYLNLPEPDFASTYNIYKILNYPFNIIDQFIFLFSNPGILNENIWFYFREFFIFFYLFLDLQDLFSNIFQNSFVFSLNTLLWYDYTDFLTFLEILLIRIQVGFFFYDFFFFFLKFINLLLYFLLIPIIGCFFYLFFVFIFILYIFICFIKDIYIYIYIYLLN
jgi:hypothetical protein